MICEFQAPDITATAAAQSKVAQLICILVHSLLRSRLTLPPFDLLFIDSSSCSQKDAFTDSDSLKVKMDLSKEVHEEHFCFRI